MNITAPDISQFFIAGINYRKTDAAIRSQFAISSEQYKCLLEDGPQWGITEFFIISTCNRTEIYGFAENAGDLIDLLCTQTEGDAATFQSLAYIKQGIQAVDHLFTVGAGLDSQILGDYEIVGQIKQAAKFSKQYNCLGAFTERLVNAMLQASKAIKNQTNLSGGTVSVSFAAVQYIRENCCDIKNKNILLVGTGKIGRNTCKNLVDYLETKNITLINRSPEKAQNLAIELGLEASPLDSIKEKAKNASIILVATNSTEPAILKEMVENSGDKLIIDLSIPYNVEPSVAGLLGIQVVNVDELSKLKDETLAKRQADVPKARAILATITEEFMEWYCMRQNVPVLKAVKHKLQEIHTSPLFIPLYNHNPRISTDEKIQRVINGMAIKMKGQNQKGCHYIEAINEFIATGTI